MGCKTLIFYEKNDENVSEIDTSIMILIIVALSDQTLGSNDKKETSLTAGML